MEAFQQRRPQLMRRRSSIELRLLPENSTSKKRKLPVLSVIRSSTLTLVTTAFFTYAWLLSIGVGSSFLAFSLIDTAQDTLQSFQRDQQTYQGFLDHMREETLAARETLEASKDTCMLQHSSFDDSELLLDKLDFVRDDQDQ